jgi:hypothetical protein
MAVHVKATTLWRNSQNSLATNWVCTGCSYRFGQGHIHWSNKSSSSYHRWPHVYKRSSNDRFIHRKQPSQKPFYHGIKPESLFQQSSNSKTKLSLSYFIQQSDRQTTRHVISKTNVSRQHTVFHEQFRRSYKQAIRIPTHRSKTYNRQQQTLLENALPRSTDYLTYNSINEVSTTQINQYSTEMSSCMNCHCNLSQSTTFVSDTKWGASRMRITSNGI